MGKLTDSFLASFGARENKSATVADQIEFWSALCSDYAVTPSWPLATATLQALVAAMMRDKAPAMRRHIRVSNLPQSALLDLAKGLVAEYILPKPKPKPETRGRKDEGRKRRSMQLYSLLALPHDQAKAHHWGAEQKIEAILKGHPALSPPGSVNPVKAAFSQYRTELLDTDKREKARQLMLRDRIEAFRQKLDETSQNWVMRLMERMEEIPIACRCDAPLPAGKDRQQCPTSECATCTNGILCDRALDVRELMVYQWKQMLDEVLPAHEAAEFYEIILSAHQAKIIIGRNLPPAEREYYAPRKPN